MRAYLPPSPPLSRAGRSHRQLLVVFTGRLIPLPADGPLAHDSMRSIQSSNGNVNSYIPTPTPFPEWLRQVTPHGPRNRTPNPIQYKPSCANLTYNGLDLRPRTGVQVTKKAHCPMHNAPMALRQPFQASSRRPFGPEAQRRRQCTDTAACHWHLLGSSTIKRTENTPGSTSRTLFLIRN